MKERAVLSGVEQAVATSHVEFEKVLGKALFICDDKGQTSLCRGKADAKFAKKQHYTTHNSRLISCSLAST